MAWTGTAWYVLNGSPVAFSTPHISCSPGDSVGGWMQYQGSHTWKIRFINYSTGGAYTELNLQQTNFGPDDWPFGLITLWALEGYNIAGDADVPGATTFSSIYLSRNGSQLSFSFHKNKGVGSFPQLHNLNVTWAGQTSVTLWTNNP